MFRPTRKGCCVCAYLDPQVDAEPSAHPHASRYRNPKRVISLAWVSQNGLSCEHRRVYSNVHPGERSRRRYDTQTFARALERTVKILRETKQRPNESQGERYLVSSPSQGSSVDDVRTASATPPLSASPGLPQLIRRRLRLSPLFPQPPSPLLRQSRSPRVLQ